MINASLDIETFSTKPNGIIHEIAIVLFSDVIEAQYCWKIDWNQNRQFEASTIKWWLNQPTEMQHRLIDDEGRVPLDVALEEISKILTKDVFVWANSPRFDCEFLANAYSQLARDIPWDFRKERDFRTLLFLSPVEKNMITNDAPHTALGDALYQARLIIASLTALRVGLDNAKSM